MIAYVYQPHYKTNCFRVDAKCCTDDVNYIIICDERSSYAGVWMWYKKDVELKAWMNGKRLCYQIPINKCIKIRPDLSTLKPKGVEMVKKVCEQVRKKEC